MGDAQAVRTLSHNANPQLRRHSGGKDRMETAGMLQSVGNLEGMLIGATDGTIGKVRDFYFDDEAWVVRYAVVDTTAWLPGRKVLVSPYLIGEPVFGAGVLPVSVTQERIRHSPDVDTDKPVSRQYEESYLGYYGYPVYWGGSGLWGQYGYPGTISNGMIPSAYRGPLRTPTAAAPGADPHLRSCNAVKGYHIHAADGEIGHVGGYLLDGHTWSLRYLVVNTSNWRLGHDVLISPEWVQDLSWHESMVYLSLPRQMIRDAPAYDDNAPLDRAAEHRLFTHYGRDAYWRTPASPTEETMR